MNDWLIDKNVFWNKDKKLENAKTFYSPNLADGTPVYNIIYKQTRLYFKNKDFQINGLSIKLTEIIINSDKLMLSSYKDTQIIKDDNQIYTDIELKVDVNNTKIWEHLVLLSADLFICL